MEPKREPPAGVRRTGKLAEWAFEGKLKRAVSKPERHSVTNGSVCWYAQSGRASVKPGGTARVSLLSQQ